MILYGCMTNQKERLLNQVSKTLERSLRSDFPSGRSDLPDSTETEGTKPKVVHIDRLRAYHGNSATDRATDLNNQRQEQNGVADQPVL